MDKKDIDIEITDNNLEVKVEKKAEEKEEDKDYLRYERSYRGFYRSFPLPEDADKKGIKATYKNGVLEITVKRKPKAVKKKPVSKVRIE